MDGARELPKFVHLNAKSSYSLLEGVPAVKKLSKYAAEHGHLALGVTEIGNLFSAVEASRYLPEFGVQPILGCELPVEMAAGEGSILGYITLLVQDAEGWKNLARLVSHANLAKVAADNPTGAEKVRWDDVVAHSEGLIALSGPMLRGAVGKGFRAAGSKGLAQVWEPLAKAFDNRFYLQLERHNWSGDMGREVKELEAALVDVAVKNSLPLVACNDSRFLKTKELEAFEALVCIGDSTTLDDPNRRKFTPQHALRDASEMLETFKDLPEACENTVEIAQRCAYLIPAVKVKQMFMPKWTFSGEKPVNQVIREESEAGLEERLRDHVYPMCADEGAREIARAKYYEQLDYELGIIGSMGFDGYFLITSDFIKWAKSKNIPVGPGRGSGAGSVVAWSLQITDLDPIRWELYFERFLNPERVSLPDFDVDFCQDRREEVIAYVRDRFGADRVSQIITFGTLKAKACLRDVGRVLGLPYGFVGQIAGFVPEGPNPPSIGEVLEQDERLKARYDTEDDVKKLVDVATQLEGCYRHASTHAAGVIITDRPIDEVCGLYVDPRSPMPATQVNMKDAEYAGLVKFDFLGLKTLTVIQHAIAMVKASGGPEIDPLKIPLDDAKTYKMLTEGHTVGVFQIESAGMTDLTKKMKANDMESLSALIALYRPGPMEWIPRYVACRLGQEEIVYPHELLKDTLEVTFGIAVYQEQVMKMARVLAGYTLGGADMLRRAMGKKIPAEMAQQREIFVKGAAEVNQIEATVANSIFDQMSAFAGYGFNKAHSMAYALISYQTAYLKAHHPLEFLAATMTYDKGNTDKLLRYKQDLARMGCPLLAPDINASGVLFEVQDYTVNGETKRSVRHALAAIKGAGDEAMRMLVAERTKGGPFKNVWDLMARVGPQVMNRKQLEVLVKAGALDNLERDRSTLLTNIDTYLSYCQACAEQRESGQVNLFGGDNGTLDAAPFKAGMRPPEEMDHLQKLQFELEVAGFYLSDHPLSTYADEVKKLFQYKPINDFEEFAAMGGGMARVAVIVHAVRTVKTKTGNRMGVVLVSDPTGQCEVAVFPEAFKETQEILESGKPLVLTLRVAQDGERLRINAENIAALTDVLGARNELTLDVPDVGLMGRIKQEFDKAGSGPTAVTLLLPAAAGRTRLKLPFKVTCNPSLMANLRGMGVGIG